MKNNIKLCINARAYQKIRHWVSLAHGEVSGLGIISEVRNEQNILTHFIIDDVYLIKQLSGNADTTLDAEAIGQFLVELVQQGIDTSKVKLWWHSHGTMDVFWSTTDEQCIRDLTNSSYMISLVTNKMNKNLVRLDVYQPFQITLNDIGIELVYPKDAKLEEFCKNEFKAKVTEHSIIPSQQSMFTRDELRPCQFPGRDEKYDAEIEQLEYLFSHGQLTLEELQEKLDEIEFRREMETA